MTNITPIVAALFGLLASIITVFVIPWLKSNIEANKLSQIMAIAKLAVEAAEQIFKETGMGAKKKEYVEAYLAERGYKLDADELDVIIESAVKELKLTELAVEL